MSARSLPAVVLLALTAACGAGSPSPSPTPAAVTVTATAAATPTPTATATPVVRDEVLLDLTGSGSLPESRPFTIRAASVNICWRLSPSADAGPAELGVRLQDAMTREEVATVNNAGAPAGCRAVSIRGPGRPHSISVTIAPGATWHIAVVGQ